MGTEKAPLKGLAAAGADDLDGDSGRIGADNCVRWRDSLQPCHQFLFGAGPLDNRLDNPVALRGRGLQIVLDSAQRDQVGLFRAEKAGRLCLRHALETCLNQPMAYSPVLQRQPFGLLLRRQFRRRDIEQMGGDAGIGQVTCDCRAHCAGADDGCVADCSAHRVAPDSFWFLVISFELPVAL